MSEARKTHVEAPVKQLWVGLATGSLTAIAAPSGAVVFGLRVAARGRCPGKGCKQVVTNDDPELVRLVVERHPGKLGEVVCSTCGQRSEVYCRTVVRA